LSFKNYFVLISILSFSARLGVYFLFQDTLGMTESDIVNLRNALMDHACAYAAATTSQSSGKKKNSSTPPTTTLSLLSTPQSRDFLLGTWKSSTNIGRWQIATSNEDGAGGAAMYCTLLPSAKVLKKKRGAAATAANSGADHMVNLRVELVKRPVR
jgi:hypothetical protein